MEGSPMNAVEIEEAISRLVAQPFDCETFPYAFLEAFGNKPTTIKRLRSGAYNQSDQSGVLQTNNIHIKGCSPGQVTTTIVALRNSPATKRYKARFILATDGDEFQAEDLKSTDPPIICNYPEFPSHFGFFLPLAGIATVRQISDNAFDIQATGRLNRLYLELRKDNRTWDTSERRHDMNRFMARLIFCFFAEDTGIFMNTAFTPTVEQMSDESNTQEVISEIFRAMNTKMEDRKAAEIARWAKSFPYVNGGLFSGGTDVPHFNRIARSYLLNIGNLDWKKINPDIFGSMIQAVADDKERGALGMHYTSVPNILKVLNPLFLDDLRDNLDKAKDNPRKLLNLRNRMSRIRVFDPACGSGNFLVIAYKEMRAIEAEINKQRGEADLPTTIPLTNFRGIELRDFPAEIARLALIIAEYQCDELYRGQKEALVDFLPLTKKNWITCGNALQLDWLNICPSAGKKVKVNYTSNDLFRTPPEQSEIDFDNEGRETYICGNPPYLGSGLQSPEQKEDLKSLFHGRAKNWKSLDYVAGWFMKVADYGQHASAAAAFVATNSICQGQQVPILWPLIFKANHKIAFAHTSFKWANLASHNAGVTVVIIGISKHVEKMRRLYSQGEGVNSVLNKVENINQYLVAAPNIFIEQQSDSVSHFPKMGLGNVPRDNGKLLLTGSELTKLNLTKKDQERFIRQLFGSQEFIKAIKRYCLWIDDSDISKAYSILTIKARIDAVRQVRLASKRPATRAGSQYSHRFDEKRQQGGETVIIVPRVSSENRQYLPCGLLPPNSIVLDSAFALYDAPLWTMALIASRLHLIWIATVCGKLETRYRYSNTMGWNTFPLPKLTEKNREDLTRCAEDILLAREAHFPATIAELYDPQKMPENLRHAHDRNDECLERIVIGRRFKNDTERLEKLFALYVKMSDAPKCHKPHVQG